MLLKGDDPSSIPVTHTKSQVWWHTCDPGAGEGERDRQTFAAHWPVSLADVVSSRL